MNINQDQPETAPGVDRGTFGDAGHDNTEIDPRTCGSRKQEDVDDRENVSTVKPEDYPMQDREISTPK